MKHKISIGYEESTNGISGVMLSPGLENMEREIMLRKKSEVEAAFLQSFGVQGEFKFSVVRSTFKNKIGWNGRHGYRVIFRIIPDNARTYAILRQHPGWINRFI